MSLLTLNVDLSRVAAALERIASILEFACPRPLSVDRPQRKESADGDESVYTLTDEDVWLRENLEDALQETGQPVSQIPEMADKILKRMGENNRLP